MGGLIHHNDWLHRRPHFLTPCQSFQPEALARGSSTHHQSDTLPFLLNYAEHKALQWLARHRSKVSAVFRPRSLGQTTTTTTPSSHKSNSVVVYGGVGLTGPAVTAAVTLAPSKVSDEAPAASEKVRWRRGRWMRP